MIAVGEIKNEFQRYANGARNLEAVKHKLAGWDRTIQFSLEGEEPFNLKFHSGSVTFHDGVAERPNVTFRAQANIFQKIIDGELDSVKAYMTRQLRIEGSLSDAMKFAEISNAIRRSVS